MRRQTKAESIRLTLNNSGYHAEHFSYITDLDHALQQQLPDTLMVDVDLLDTTDHALYAAKHKRRNQLR